MYFGHKRVENQSKKNVVESTHKISYCTVDKIFA